MLKSCDNKEFSGRNGRLEERYSKGGRALKYILENCYIISGVIRTVVCGGDASCAPILLISEVHYVAVQGGTLVSNKFVLSTPVKWQ